MAEARTGKKLHGFLYFGGLIIVLALLFALFFFLSCDPDVFGDYRYAVCEPIHDSL